MLSTLLGLTVLAAVERSDGEVYAGANVEIVNYSLTKHAEETAVLAAIADGALALGDQWLTAVYTRDALRAVAAGSSCGSGRFPPRLCASLISQKLLAELYQNRSIPPPCQTVAASRDNG